MHVGGQAHLPIPNTPRFSFSFITPQGVAHSSQDGGITVDEHHNVDISFNAPGGKQPFVPNVGSISLHVFDGETESMYISHLLDPKTRFVHDYVPSTEDGGEVEEEFHQPWITGDIVKGGERVGEATFVFTKHAFTGLEPKPQYGGVHSCIAISIRKDL